MIRINNILTRCTSGVTMGGRFTGGGGSTWTLNFTGLDCLSISCGSNTQTVPENVTLYFLITPDVGTQKPTWDIQKNFETIFISDGTGPLDTTLSFNAGDTIRMTVGNISLSTGTITIRQDNSSGRLIASVPYAVQD